MTDTRDKLAILVEGKPTSDVDECRELADAILAALPDMVKPLVWTVRDEKTQFAIRRYVAKNYIIEERLYGDCFDLWIGVNATSAVRFNSIKEAKAAADAHHRAAILAAFGVNT